jgi:hypothetical protein
MFCGYRWETHEAIDTRPFSHHPYQYAYANPVNYLDPTGKCVPESDGPYACNPSLRSALKQYLRDSHPFDNRARGDQAFNGINVVFDSYPDTAYTYALLQDSELRAFIAGQLSWLDAEATIAQLNFNLQEWRLNYAQKNNLDSDLWGATVGVLSLGAVYGVECFFSPDTGGGGGGGGGMRIPLRQGELFERYAQTSTGTVGVLAEVSLEGTTLHLKDLAVYPVGTKHLDVGQREMAQLTRQLAEEARDLGFEQLRISGLRYSGAKRGKVVDFTIDLK